MGKQSVLDGTDTNAAVKKKKKTSCAVAVKKKTSSPSSTEVQETKMTNGACVGGSEGNAIRDAFYSSKSPSSNLPEGIEPKSLSPTDVSKEQQLAEKMKQVKELTSLVRKAKAEVHSRKKKILQHHLEVGNSKALQDSPVKKSSEGSPVNSVGSASRPTAETTSTAKPAVSTKVKKISIKKKSKAAVEQEREGSKTGETQKMMPHDKSDRASSRMATAIINDDNKILEVSKTTKGRKMKAKSFSIAEEVLKKLPKANGEESLSSRSLDVSSDASTNSSPSGPPTEIKRKKRRAIKVLRKIESGNGNTSLKVPTECEPARHLENSPSLERRSYSVQRPSTPRSSTPVITRSASSTPVKAGSSTPVNPRPTPSTSDNRRSSTPVNLRATSSSPVKSFSRSLSVDIPTQSPLKDPNSLLSQFGGGRSPKSPAKRGVRAAFMRASESKSSVSPTFSPITPMAPSELGGLRRGLAMIQPICTDSPSDSETKSLPSSVMSKRNLFENLFEQKASGGNGMSIPDDIAMTPRTLKGGFVALNTATPASVRKPSAAPPKRIFDGIHHDHDRSRGYADSAVAMLKDKSKETEIRALVGKIDATDGFPATRRLSMRDNELVGRMTLAIRNDPSITSIEVTPDVFGTISSNLLAQFIDALRINLHVKSLNFSGVELGNDFLYSLATSMESNFVIEEIDLSMNLFTNAGLAEFCQALAISNDTCKKLNLENQTTPISNASEFFVLEAFRENTTLDEVKLDFQSEDAAKELEEIIERNRSSLATPVDKDDKLLTLLRYEAERSEELWHEQNEEEAVVHVQDDDWNHLYELSVLFDKRKLKKEVQDAAEDAFVPATQRRNGDSMSKEEKKAFLFGEFRKSLGESIGCFNSDGSFLTDEFIAKFFKENPEEDSLTFDFHGQWKLFKRFPVHDPDRPTIVNKFVDALVGHSRANEITGINMANTGCGDDFLIALSDRCLQNPSLLPNLYMINFETNFINEDGVCAIAKLIASPNTLKFLQVVRLENQKGLLKSKAEFMLAKAMRINFSIVVLSLRIRNLMERQQISKYVVRNVEFIRQARQRHFKATGQQRERNQVEKFFDNIAENDPTILEIVMTGNKRFLTLTPEEKVRAAKSLATNKYVTTVTLNGCGIDDEFVKGLASSLKCNNTIERLHLEGNDISGDGIMALFEALAQNSSVEELRLHKQSKLLNTSDEHVLADILEPNTTITKLGIDLRTKMAQVAIDRKLKLNRNLSLKLRAESKGIMDLDLGDSFASLKF